MQYDIIKQTDGGEEVVATFPRLLEATYFAEKLQYAADTEQIEKNGCAHHRCGTRPAFFFYREAK